MAQVRWREGLALICLGWTVGGFQAGELSSKDLDAYYACGGNKVVYQMNFWENYGVKPTSAPFLSSNDMCYVVDANRKMRCFDPEGGELYVDQFEEYDVCALYSPSFNGEGDMCFLTDPKEVVYLRFDGKEYGRYRSVHAEFSPPVIGKNGKIYFARAGVGYSMDTKGQIDVVEDFFGQQGARDEELTLLPLCDPEGRLYWVVIHGQEELIVFDPAGSSYFCQIENLTLRPGSIMISSDKHLFYVTEKGTLIAINSRDGVVQQTAFSIPWCAGRDSSGNIYFGMEGKVCWALPSLAKVEQREVHGAVIGAPVLWPDNTMCFLLTGNEVCWVKHFEGFL